MKIYLSITEDNWVDGYGSSPSDNTVEIEVPEDHPVLRVFREYRYVDGELVEDLSMSVKEERVKKDEEFNKICQQMIVSGFKYDIRGDQYHFSYDTEAQMNLQSVRELLREDLIPYVSITVKDNKGLYTRVLIRKSEIDGLLVAAVLHRDSIVDYYRGPLTDKLNNATTIEEIEGIAWDYKPEM